MPRTTDPKIIEAIRADFKGGLTGINQLAKKHKVSWPTAHAAIKDLKGGARGRLRQAAPTPVSGAHDLEKLQSILQTHADLSPAGRDYLLFLLG